MPKKQKAFWEDLSKDTKDIIAIFALLVGVLFLVFLIQNPIVGGFIVITLLVIGGTFYWKIKTGKWWFERNQTTTSNRNDDQPRITSGPPPQPLTKSPPDLGSPDVLTRQDQPAPPPVSIDHSLEVQSLISKIRQFRPQRRIRDERQYQDSLFGFMSATYPSLKTEVPFPNKKYIDAMVGNVGIELKFEPNESEFDRLYSQVESYLDHMQSVIVVISRPRSPHSLRYFEDKLRRRSWLDSRVFIIEQTM